MEISFVNYGLCIILYFHYILIFDNVNINLSTEVQDTQKERPLFQVNAHKKL